MVIGDKYTFFEMTPELVAKCGEFSCAQDKDIEAFFHGRYNNYSQERIGRSYCFVDEDNKDLVCAFTLSNSVLNRDTLTNRMRNRIQRRIRYDAQRKDYPSILIGQLVVFDKYREFHLGDELMNFIKGLMVQGAREVSYRIKSFDFVNTGSRFLLVDATNKPKVLSYYKNNGFDFLFNSEEDEIRELSKTVDDALDEYRQTRLMYFDLITLS